MIKTLRVLSLGAGVQSTTIALRIADGDYPPIDAAIFADTQDEPRAVYDHLQWLERETKHAFPIIKATAGRLGDDLMARGTPDARFASIPAFTMDHEDEDAEVGKTRRACTADYKLAVIERVIRRQLLGLAPRQRIPKGTTIVQIIGLSADEPGRVLRVRANCTGSFFKPEFPLHESGETRANCLAYLEQRVPHKVPRSACVFCPMHNNYEWRMLRDHDPEGWARAVEVDDGMRKPWVIVNRGRNAKLYLHRSCVPLSQADISGPDAKPLQYGLNFARECKGMCGM